MTSASQKNSNVQVTLEILARFGEASLNNYPLSTLLYSSWPSLHQIMRAWNFNLFTWKVPKKYRNLSCPDITESGQGVLCSAPKKQISDAKRNCFSQGNRCDRRDPGQVFKLLVKVWFVSKKTWIELKSIVPFSEDVASCTHCLEPPVEPQWELTYSASMAIV